MWRWRYVRARDGFVCVCGKFTLAGLEPTTGRSLRRCVAAVLLGGVCGAEVLLRMGQELEALEPTTVQLLRAFFSSPQSQAALQLPPPAAGGSAGASQAAPEPEAPQPGRRRRRSAAPAEPAPRWQVDTVQVTLAGGSVHGGSARRGRGLLAEAGVPESGVVLRRVSHAACRWMSRARAARRARGSRWWTCRTASGALHLQCLASFLPACIHQRCWPSLCVVLRAKGRVCRQRGQPGAPQRAHVQPQGLLRRLCAVVSGHHSRSLPGLGAPHATLRVRVRVLA